MKALLVILFCWTMNFGWGQTIFYQDVFNGGVTGDGFAVGIGEGQGYFNVNIPTNSIIKKGILFCGRHGLANNINIGFNGNTILFDENSVISNYFNSPEYGGHDGGFVHAIDVTNYINSSNNTYSISIPYQGIYANRYVDFYLVIIYENISFDPIALSIQIALENF